MSIVRFFWGGSGRKGPFHYRGWDGVPGLPVRRGAALRLGAAPMGRKKKVNDYGTGIPYHEVEALARVLLPEIQAFFESEEGQREFHLYQKMI